MDRTRTYQAAGITLAVSAAIGVIANALHPRFDSAIYDDPAAYIAEIDASGLWLIDHLVLVAVILGLTLGGVGLAAHLTEEERPRPWAAAALVAVIVAGATSLLGIFIDGFAMPAFASAVGAGAAGAAAMASVDTAIFVGLGLMPFGLVPMILGMALVRSDAYPHWTGFVALASGVFGIVTGVIVATQGGIVTAATVTFLIASIPLTLTQIVLGSMLRRHAIEEAPGHAATPTPA